MLYVCYIQTHRLQTCRAEKLFWPAVPWERRRHVPELAQGSLQRSGILAKYCDCPYVHGEMYNKHISSKTVIILVICNQRGLGRLFLTVWVTYGSWYCLCFSDISIILLILHFLSKILIFLIFECSARKITHCSPLLKTPSFKRHRNLVGIFVWNLLRSQTRLMRKEKKKNAHFMKQTGH